MLQREPDAYRRLHAKTQSTVYALFETAGGAMEIDPRDTF